MTPEQEKAIDRVRKLLALAGSANENEAMAANDKAQQIMAELNLSMADVTDKVEDGIIEDASLESDSRPWRRTIGTHVALLYFCDYVYGYKKYMTSARACGYIRRDQHIFFGAPHNVAVAQMMFMYFCDTIIRLAKDGSQQYTPRERTKYITTFQKACARRLASRLYDKYEAIMAAKQGKGDGSNLPALYDQTREQMENFMKGSPNAPDPDHTPRPPVPYSHGAAEREGKEAAEKIGLDVQLKHDRGSGFMLDKK
jgi:hypothetical protein